MTERFSFSLFAFPLLLPICKCCATANKGLPRWLSGKESSCQCRGRGLDPWVGKIPGGRKRQPLQGSCLKIPWTEEPGLQSMGLQRVEHNLVTKQQHTSAQRISINFKLYLAKRRGCTERPGRCRPSLKSSESRWSAPEKKCPPQSLCPRDAQRASTVPLRVSTVLLPKKMA